MNYGLIATKLGHSFSKEIHGLIGNNDYAMRELPEEEFDAFMREKDFLGINVTIPYKTAVIPYLDTVDERARQIGAVNTVVNRGGKLYGYNTDFDGMTALFARAGIEVRGKKALILGSGGTSRTARAVLAALGASEISFVRRDRRDGALTYGDAYNTRRDVSVIVNTTPCGMFPNGGALPTDENGNGIDLDAFPQLEAVVDVIFNPLNTALVLEARKRGIKACGGLYMLVSQAVFAEELFTGVSADGALTDRIYAQILREKQNLVLIGMPGSGKTTVGRILAARLGKEFIDLDELTARRVGRTPDAIIREDGERFFRDCETGAAFAAAARTGAVIATGGGCVLRDINMDALRRNGVICMIDRPPEDILPTADRPLSSDREKLRALYDQRYPLYLKNADLTVRSKDSAEETASQIERRLEENVYE